MTADCTAREPGSHDDLYGSLINILPSYELGGGVSWSLDVSVLGADIVLGGPHDLYNFTKTLPTSCLAFDKQGTVVEPTSTAAATVKSSATHGMHQGTLLFSLLLTIVLTALVVL